MMAPEREGDTCSVVAMDPNSITYSVCAACEKPLPIDSVSCKFCVFRAAFNAPPFRTKRLFRLMLSIATDTKVMVVICFDRAARILFGCSADDFFSFAKVNPFAEEKASKVLVGEFFRMSLKKPMNSHAEHLRVASVVPLSSSFVPIIETLKTIYQVDDLITVSKTAESRPRKVDRILQRPNDGDHQLCILRGVVSRKLQHNFLADSEVT